MTFCAPDERSLLRDIEKMLKTEIPVEKAPEGTYVDALADPDGDFAPLNRNSRQRQGARPQGSKPQGQARKPQSQGRKPSGGQNAGKPGANRHQPAAAANQNGEQPASKQRRRRRSGDRRPRPEQAGGKTAAQG